MGSDEVTLEILRGIRDEIRGTNARVDELAVRLDQTNARLDARIDTVARRVVESEVRVTTAIHESTATMREVRDILRDRFDLRDRVERCEHEIAEIKRRLD